MSFLFFPLYQLPPNSHARTFHYPFVSGKIHIWMWELDYKENWPPKNWCFWTVVLEKSLESPLDCKEIQPVHSEGDQPWDFFGRTDAKAETPVLWPPHVKSWSLEKILMLGGIGGRRKRGWWQRIKWLNGITDMMAWVWVGSRSWWWTGKPGILQSMRSQRVWHDLAIEQQQHDSTEIRYLVFSTLSNLSVP